MTYNVEIRTASASDTATEGFKPQVPGPWQLRRGNMAILRPWQACGSLRCKWQSPAELQGNIYRWLISGPFS